MMALPACPVQGQTFPLAFALNRAGWDGPGGARQFRHGALRQPGTTCNHLAIIVGYKGAAGY